MLPSDLGHLTSKRTRVFPNNLNAAIGNAWSYPPKKLDDGIKDRENQNQLLQQALAVSTYLLYIYNFFRCMTY